MTLIVISFGYYINKPIYNPKLHDLSYLLLSKEGKPLELRLSNNGYWRMPVKLEEVDDKFIKLLIAYEDKRFYDHKGVDFLALFRSLKNNISKDRIVSGASTITMQTARLIDPKIKRDYLGKINQIFLAWRIENQFTKKEILEIYLTLAPYGGNIEGIKAASYAWLGKKPNNLTWSESAMLVSLPQSPEKRRPDLFPEESQKAKNLILSKVKNKFGFSENFIEETYSESNNYQKRKIKSYAPHLFDKLYTTNSNIIESTINFNTQVSLYNIMENYVSYYPSPINGASIILERKTGNVIAYVGSSDYLNKTRKGGNNFLEALRSPGSTLKPLIYSEALSRNLISPYEIFDDKKSVFGSYTPSNFNDFYDGKISLEEALKDSKNISAIQTLKLLDPLSFEKKIKHNFKLNSNFNNTSGLTLAVGGLYITPEDLATMYLTLAEEGKIKDLNFINSFNYKPIKNKIFKKSATNNVLGLLSKYDKSGKKITLKTGTSYDQQDAWAAMITKDHVIITWLGTPDNTPTQLLIGSKDAEPLAIKIANLLNYEPPIWEMNKLFLKANNNRKINSGKCSNIISQPLNNDVILVTSQYLPVKSNKENVEWFIDGKLTKKNIDNLMIPNYGFINISAKKDNCIETINILIKGI